MGDPVASALSPVRSVLVANRGEIAVRIFATLADLGIRSIAVFSDADANARHVAAADSAVRIGPAAAAQSYLDIDAVLAAAVRSGADAIHPGYGFLAERAAFARAVIDAGLRWIGPPPEAIEAMGDKIAAKLTVAAAGVPVVPGVDQASLDDEALRAAAVDIGLPVLLKPSAGGGGKGMRLVEAEADLADEITSARRQARAVFGDDTILVERWISRPRHIEVQVLADSHGAIVALGERECSLQRRHQKIVEEAPSPLLDDRTRHRLAASAIDVARACGYVGAGTVELLVSADRPEEYFFMEMNTRLQVEHPVTEMVWGIDLVAWQIRVANGEHLPWRQVDLAPRGHAVEARIYAEDPSRGFLPASGTVLACSEPVGAGVRVDSSLVEGLVVGTDYDPMLAKIIAWGSDRAQARQRLRRALGETVVLGVTTNTGFVADLVDHPDVVAGDLDTGLVERALPFLVSDPEGPAAAEAAIAAGLMWALDAEPVGDADGIIDPWDVPGGWRIGETATTTLDLSVEGRRMAVAVTGRACSATVAVDAGPVRSGRSEWTGPGRLRVVIDGVASHWSTAGSGEDRYLGRDGHTWRVRRHVLDAATSAAVGTGGPVTSPMPGTVLSVVAAQGEAVVVGSPLVVVEAMKMEHTVVAPVDGTVSDMRVAVGQSVALEEVLAVVEAALAGELGEANETRT
ncbi:MAG: acetyl/propionyl-CoA carboxylase subunit alpha [Actinomycetota bacterium]|nr:acetyl/propionyl-CoA carboxylase subunit alpha [Actinomycetota bacterium]